MNVRTLSNLLGPDTAERLDRALDHIGALAMHEAESLDRHLLAVRERVQVARKARGVGELLRNQVDLLPATAARIARDHQIRRSLWRKLGTALRA